jgi:hypothetical protein
VKPLNQPRYKAGDAIYQVVLDVIEHYEVENSFSMGADVFGERTEQGQTLWRYQLGRQGGRGHNVFGEYEMGREWFDDLGRAEAQAGKNRLAIESAQAVIRAGDLSVSDVVAYTVLRHMPLHCQAARVGKLAVLEKKPYSYPFLHLFATERETSRYYNKLAKELAAEGGVSADIKHYDLYRVNDKVWSGYEYAARHGDWALLEGQALPVAEARPSAPLSSSATRTGGGSDEEPDEGRRRGTMPTKLQAITALYAETLEKVTANAQEWMAFLSSACMNYKLPFDEQVLVYAQRPDATAVLELERWNGHFDRWVKRGSKGIAVLSDESASGMKHYFDLSQTTPGTQARPVPVWSMAPEYTPDVTEALEAAFGELGDTGTFTSSVRSACANAAEDNLADYLDDLRAAGKDGRESGRLSALIESSVAFMVLYRLGCDSQERFDEWGFSALGSLTDARAATILGTAVSAISEMVLREVAATVLTLERDSGRNRTFAPASAPGHTEGTTESNATIETDGRSEDGVDLSRDERGLPDARPRSAESDDPRHRDVGTVPQGVLEGEPQRDIRGDEDRGDVVFPPRGDKPTGRSDVGAAGGADGGSAGSGRQTETREPDGLGGADERDTQPGNRDGEQRADLQLGGPPGRPADTAPHERADDGQSPALSVSEGTLDSYHLPLGTPVLIGSKEYEIGELGTDTVSLTDPTAPLFPVEMDRGEFDRRLVENPLNDHLRGSGLSQPVEAVAAEAVGRVIDKTAPTREQGQVKPAEEKKPTPLVAQPLKRHDFTITDDGLGRGGAKERYRWNVEAIRTLQAIESEGRPAAPDEQQALSRYVGWGGNPAGIRWDKRLMGT